MFQWSSRDVSEFRDVVMGFIATLADTIVPIVPKNGSPACVNDYRPVALASVVMKCFERLIKD